MVKFTQKKSNGLKKLYEVLYDDTTIDIESLLEEIVQCGKSKFSPNSVDDVFIVMKKYDVGVKKTLILYNENQDKVFSIHE